MLITNDDGNVLNDTFIDLASKAKIYNYSFRLFWFQSD